MKRAISVLMATIIATMTFFISNMPAFAEQSSVEKAQLGNTGTYYEYDADSHTLTISGAGVTPDFSSNGNGQPWFDYRSEIDKVIFDDEITSLGKYFLYSVSASEIKLPKSLDKIESYALSNTSGVSNWNLPFGLTSIGTYAFYNCTAITSINVPDTVTKILSYAFNGCTGLTKIVIPYSVSSLGSYAFQKCSKLESVEFENLTSNVNISSNCFLNCPKLKDVTIPKNATVNSYSFGYISKTSKMDDMNFNVYENSSAYFYALRNFGVDAINLYNTIPTKCAIGYSNTFEDYNDTFTYEFTPETTEEYNIYSRGECDVKAVLMYDNKEIATSDDISQADANFAIKQTLIANRTYQIIVSSNHMTESYTLWIYPNEIKSFTADGKANAHDTAQPNMKTVNDEILSNIVLSIEFENGLTDKIYYKNDFFDGRYLGQKEAKLNCGESNAIIGIDDMTAEIPVYIDHSYSGVVVPYTVDDDGYTLYTCVLCKNDSYKDDYVPTPAIKIKGTTVFAENSSGDHSENKPYPYIEYIKVRDTKSIAERRYYVDENGNFTINTFNNISVTFVTKYGNRNATFSFKADEIEPYSVIEYGEVAVNPYDFDSNYRINAKDYAIYLKHKDEIGDDEYLKHFKQFVLDDVHRYVFD